MRITLNEVVVVGRQARRSLLKVSSRRTVREFYKVYLYRLVVMLPSHDVIYKRK